MVYSHSDSRIWMMLGMFCACWYLQNITHLTLWKARCVVSLSHHLGEWFCGYSCIYHLVRMNCMLLLPFCKALSSLIL